MKTNIKNSILASLMTDSYCLGSHWIYDEIQIQDITFDWNKLNAPLAMWHNGKIKGDFTHYGDQALFLLKFMSENKIFNKDEFYFFWKEKMSNYKGYIDGSTRDALENIGASSNDLSICGRIAPLLLEDNTKEKFLQNVAAFVSLTHNSKLAKSASRFFAELLWLSLENQDIQKNIQDIKSSYPMLLNWINEGVATKDKDTFKTIRAFGPACGIDGGFAGVIHLLSLDDDFKNILIKNAKAGGDSSARGMVVAMILATKKNIQLPKEWEENLNKLPEINKYLQEF